MTHRKRFSIDLPEDWQNYLGNLAKTHKITQGEIVELLLANMHKCVGIEQEFTDRRQARVQARTSKSSMTAAFKALTPEQQRAVLNLP